MQVQMTSITRSDPWVVIFASCEAHKRSYLLKELQVDDTIVYFLVYTYFFCHTIEDFGGQIFTNLQFALEVFPRVVNYFWPRRQNPRLDCCP
ncbi:hypothetical protein TSUD_307750 [Trifolium subterraneum]|nr:hypothetical protein TSUD_307750 [Trifolium subterraneum]